MAKAKSLETAFEELETTIAALESGDYKAIAARARQFVEALKL